MDGYYGAFSSVLTPSNWETKREWGPYGEYTYEEFRGDFYIDDGEAELFEMLEKIKFYEGKFKEQGILEKVQEEFTEHLEDL